MGREKTGHSVLMTSWISKLPVAQHRYFRIDGNMIFCEPCCKGYKIQKSTGLQQHVETLAHIKSARMHDAKPERQILVTDQEFTRNPFYEDMAETFVAANIPWAKLKNPVFKTFVEKYTKRSFPDESTLRKGYLKPMYAKALESIRADIGTHPVWIGVDETTDVQGRYIANVLVGAMRKDKPTDAHVLMSREIPEVNNSTITRLILDSFALLWPGCTQAAIEEKFLLFLSDGFAYMVKVGKNLKAMYTQLLHVTCVAHGINLVDEEVRSHFQKVDQMIGSVKVFRKAPQRILKLKKLYPNMQLPPRPILIRWGTWLEAIEYYASNYENIKTVVLSFNEHDAKCIETANKLLEDPDVKNDLAYISANFTFLARTLKQLQEKYQPISFVLAQIDDALDKLSHVNGDVGKAVFHKLHSTLNKNQNLVKVRAFSQILSGDNTQQVPEGYEPARIAAFFYVPLTTVDAERSFSIYKTLLPDNRRCTTSEHLEMGLVSRFELNLK